MEATAATLERRVRVIPATRKPEELHRDHDGKMRVTDIFSSLTHISVSCLHFGQNSGKFLSTVSMRIFVRVLLLQIGQLIHSIIIQQVHCSRNG